MRNPHERRRVLATTGAAALFMLGSSAVAVAAVDPDMNHTDYWESVFEGEGFANVECVKRDSPGAYTVPNDADYIAVIIKAGAGDDASVVIRDPAPGALCPVHPGNGKDISHVIWCTAEDTTTTTTTPTTTTPTSTTTTPTSTTTTPTSTTTTPTSTTTTPTSTTTTPTSTTTTPTSTTTTPPSSTTTTHIAPPSATTSVGVVGVGQTPAVVQTDGAAPLDPTERLLLALGLGALVGAGGAVLTVATRKTAGRRH